MDVRKPPERGVALLRGHAALLDAAAEVVADPLARLLGQRGIDLDADRVDARLRADLGDPGAHRAEPDDADGCDLPGHDGGAYRRIAAACLNGRMAATVGERKLLVAGEWVETGEWREVLSPFSGEEVGRVAAADAALTRKAVDAAAAAMREPLTAHERAGILERVALLLADRQEEAAQTISAEAGKPMKAARVEASRAVSTYETAAAVCRRATGETIPMDASPAGAGKLAFTMRVPIGVVGAISPFNFPMNLVAHKIAPALAAGCSVVLKPAGQTPLSALFLAELETEAGLPPGWLNVLVGKASDIGDVLVEDERVKMITFTGSSGVGWALRERAAQKKVTLELGNTTPVIVEADADIEEAATKLAANAFAFAGQSCISVQRIYVQRAAYDDFVARFIPKVEALVGGRPRRRRHRRRPGHRRRREGADRRLDRRGGLAGRDAARRRRGERAPAPHRPRGRDAPR